MTDPAILRCMSCQINLTDMQSRNLHYKSDWHQYNVRRRAGGKAPLSKAIFDEKIAEHLRKQRIEEQKKNVIYKCALCKKTFKSEATCQQHLKKKTQREGKE